MQIKKEIEEQILKKIIDDELGTARRNKSLEDSEFEQYIDLIDSVREPKQYEWMSDIRIPEFISHVLTQASIDANQYFRNKDFVEVYIQDSSDEALAGANAAKEIVNRTLNQKYLFHYLKFIRAKTLSQVAGKVYAKCWWEKEMKPSVETITSPEGEDIEPTIKMIPKIDRFNYDILDPRNVFTDNKYVYSIQDKDYIFIRSESTEESLKANKDKMNYFGLDELKNWDEESETETSAETYNKGTSGSLIQEKTPKGATRYFDVFERFGKYWAIVKGRDVDGYPLEIEPAIDEFGELKDKAEFIEIIMTFIISGSKKKLIRFQPTLYRDAKGNPYKPLIRGLCYIHPTNDGGMGDGKHVRELQLALDDTFNISNDRVMLATLPTFKVKKYSPDENSEVYFEPGHAIPLENPQTDLDIVEIKSDISGALNQEIFLQKMMQQVDAIYPTTMGDVPGMASTTATAVAGSETRSNMRANYKSLTFENTFLTELYWMMLQMTWDFASPETGLELAGDKIYNFDPTKDYFYKPVSASVEPEYAKESKIKNYSTILGYLVNLQHPDMVNLVNYVLGKMFEYMGDEYVNFGNKLLNPQTPIMSTGANAPAGQMMPMSNQAGVPQSPMETMTRGNV